MSSEDREFKLATIANTVEGWIAKAEKQLGEMDDDHLCQSVATVGQLREWIMALRND